MKLTEIKINQINQDIEKALQAVMDKHGLVISKKLRASYTESFSDIKFQYAFADNKYASEEFNFNNRYFQYGLEKTDLGKVFYYQGVEYKIIGSRTKSRKSPIIIERVSDKNIFNAPAEIVKESLKSM